MVYLLPSPIHAAPGWLDGAEAQGSIARADGPDRCPAGWLTGVPRRSPPPPSGRPGSASTVIFAPGGAGREGHGRESSLLFRLTGRAVADTGIRLPRRGYSAP